MTYRLVARAVGAEVDPEGYFLEAGFAEEINGSGFVMLFQCCAEEPDEQDVRLGMDTHCLVTADQGTAYGCVRSAVLTGNVLRVSLDPSALDALGLEDPDIEAVLEAPAEDLAQFRQMLPRVLAYGREDARPVHVAV
ncbi:Imm10 family immunity protein [Streptomyces sp. 15-116A]|uniref:Imm10 family immunity protein n=1 Tax=Streptomyces sp. 15-116A TaxID=2259035 RepID=UPI0021B35FA3|nr:Imm10 family immunity protein [Streptomyces sp. 15-116A]MCT7352694.1 Imm10 family immunity protein [Streptomyces sp. 15-116A]